MNHDLLDDLYGRFRELPLALSEIGHEIRGICLSYRPRVEGRYVDGSVIWDAINVYRLLPFGFGNYWQIVDHLGKHYKPDIVWTCSDAFHAILGAAVAKKLNAALIIDLYDNFESYSATRLPLMTAAFHRSLRLAVGLTCVSRPLLSHMLKEKKYKGQIEVIENGIPKKLFFPMDQVSSRRELELPENCYLIGTAGAIYRTRGIETLFKAYDILSNENPNIHLVLAGPCEKGLLPRGNSRIHYLGNLSQEKVPILLSAVDLTVICNRDSDFGRYCFPQKFYESISCGVPVVAAATGAMPELLHEYPDNLFMPENTESLLCALRRQINRPEKIQIDALSWDSIGVKLSNFFLKIADNRNF